MDTKELAKHYSKLTKHVASGIAQDELASDIVEISQYCLYLLEEHASVKEQLSLCNHALDSADANIQYAIRGNAVLRESLKYAIEEADGWYDDSVGGIIETEEMNRAREALSQTTTDMICITREELNAAQKDNAVLREALKFYADQDDDGERAKQALSQIPTDIICLTKEELMEPSKSMIFEGGILDNGLGKYGDKVDD